MKNYQIYLNQKNKNFNEKSFCIFDEIDYALQV